MEHDEVLEFNDESLSSEDEKTNHFMRTFIIENFSSVREEDSVSYIFPFGSFNIKSRGKLQFFLEVYPQKPYSDYVSVFLNISIAGQVSTQAIAQFLGLKLRIEFTIINSNGTKSHEKCMYWFY